MKKTIWQFAQIDEKSVEAYQKQFNIPNKWLAKLLMERELTTEATLTQFLNPDISFFHSPFLMKDLEKSVERILQARDEGERVCIYGDYDVDGITSTSVLYMFLREIGVKIEYYIPDRLSEGYGINSEALLGLASSGVQLVISVDTGITAVEQVLIGTAAGLDIIITDHHECQEVIPNAYGVINPKQADCSYPFKQLAGCGVTFKLIHGIALKLNVVKEIWKYLEIVAIGTVADIVPLIDENRIIVANAFKTMKNSWNTGLRALIAVSDVKGDITASIVGFRLGPRLNAGGRLGDAKRGVCLFLEEDYVKAVQIAETLDEENKKRQSMELTIFNEAQEWIDAHLNIADTKVIVVAKEEWHHGVIGIVASRIKERYDRPTILLAVEDGKASGSARSVEGFSIFEALMSVKPLLDKVGGHDMAAGMSLPFEKVEALRAQLNAYATIHMAADALIPKLKVDDTMALNQISVEFIQSICKLEPFGCGNEEPIFAMNGFLESAMLLGKEKNHLKIAISSENTQIEGMAFNHKDWFEEIAKGNPISILGTLNINEWNNRLTPQIMVKDLQFSRETTTLFETFFSLLTAIKNEYLVIADSGQEKHQQKEKKSSLHCIEEINEILRSNNLKPTKENFIQMYRALQQLHKNGQRQVPYYKWMAILGVQKAEQLISYWICLGVFHELKLIRFDVIDGAISFEFHEIKKVELQDSKLYNEICYDF